MKSRLIIALALGLISVVALPHVQAASKWCVAPDLPGPCSDYAAAYRKTTLTEVIEAPAREGDFVYIYPGIYTDRPIVTIPGLRIIGVSGPAVTIFDGEGSSGAALTVRAGDVVLDGFTFTHSQSAVDPGGVGGGVDAAPRATRAILHRAGARTSTGNSRTESAGITQSRRSRPMSAKA